MKFFKTININLFSRKDGPPGAMTVTRSNDDHLEQSQMPDDGFLVMGYR
jgi:hypothetical protein